ncbi:MAG: PilZ domain-containing protein [Candidatus Omnitrophota bacterium]
MLERRQCGRWLLINPVSAWLEGQDYPLECQIRDIGYKGLRIHSRTEFKKNSVIGLRFVLGSELPLNLKASVVWNGTQGREHACGVYFTDMREKDKERIHKYIQNSFREQMKQHVWDGIK